MQKSSKARISDSLAIDIPPKIGVLMVEMTKTATSIHTMMEGLPVIRTNLSVAIIPRMDPIRENREIHMA